MSARQSQRDGDADSPTGDGMVLRSGRVTQANQQTSFCGELNKRGTQRILLPESSARYLLDSIIGDQNNPASEPIKENALMPEWISTLEYRDIAWQRYFGSWGPDRELPEASG